MKNHEIPQLKDDEKDAEFANKRGLLESEYNIGNATHARRKKEEKESKKFHSLMRKSFRDKFIIQPRQHKEEIGIKDIDFYKLINNYQNSNPQIDESLNYLLNKMLILENTLTYLKTKLKTLEDDQF